MALPISKWEGGDNTGVVDLFTRRTLQLKPTKFSFKKYLYVMTPWHQLALSARINAYQNKHNSVLILSNSSRLHSQAVSVNQWWRTVCGRPCRPTPAHTHSPRPTYSTVLCPRTRSPRSPPSSQEPRNTRSSRTVRSGRRGPWGPEVGHVTGRSWRDVRRSQAGRNRWRKHDVRSRGAERSSHMPSPLQSRTPRRTPLAKQHIAIMHNL